MWFQEDLANKTRVMNYWSQNAVIPYAGAQCHQIQMVEVYIQHVSNLNIENKWSENLLNTGLKQEKLLKVDDNKSVVKREWLTNSGGADVERLVLCTKGLEQIRARVIQADSKTKLPAVCPDHNLRNSQVKIICITHFSQKAVQNALHCKNIKQQTIKKQSRHHVAVAK